MKANRLYNRITLIFFLILFIVPFTYSQDTTFIFDGTSMDGWIKTEFEGNGRVTVKDSMLILRQGSDLTGVNYIKEVPDDNYEVILEAMRMEGKDFFCGLTFPVQGSYCTLVIGGWGGSVIGLSSIDGHDAVNNFTGDSRSFGNNYWYTIKLRVANDKIEAWLNGIDKIVDFTIGNYSLSLRSEVELSAPFGIATWQTTGAIRNIRLIRL